MSSLAAVKAAWTWWTVGTGLTKETHLPKSEQLLMLTRTPLRNVLVMNS